MRVVFVFAGLLEYKGRLLKQIATLQEAGHECILIHGQTETTQPDYLNKSFPVIPLTINCHSNKFFNYANYIRFNFQAAHQITHLKPDAIVCIELRAALSGALTRLSGSKSFFVFDCNELFMEMGMPHLRKLLWRPIHSLAFITANAVLHAEENRMEYCKANYRNKAIHFLLENLPKVPLPFNPHIQHSPPIRVVYLGALIPGRHCEEIIQAFTKMDSSLISCDFIGFGELNYVASLSTLIDNLNLSNVKILPPVSNNQIIDVLSVYDIGLAFYANTSLNQFYCAPNKVYEYIVSGLAIVSNDYPGLSSVICSNNIGQCISSVSPATISIAIENILHNRIYKNITPDLILRYSWQNQADSYLRVFSKL